MNRVREIETALARLRKKKAAKEERAAKQARAISGVPENGIVGKHVEAVSAVGDSRSDDHQSVVINSQSVQGTEKVSDVMIEDSEDASPPSKKQLATSCLHSLSDVVQVFRQLFFARQNRVF